MADSQQSALQDGYCSSKAFQIREGSEIANGLADRSGGLIGKAGDNDAGVAAGRVAADIPQPAVQGDQDPSGCGSSGDNVLVGSARLNPRRRQYRRRGLRRSGLRWTRRGDSRPA